VDSVAVFVYRGAIDGATLADPAASGH